jgi:hypothetical protein
MPPTSDESLLVPATRRALNAIGGPVSLAVRDGKTASALPCPSDHKIVRQACHILAELGDDELTAAWAHRPVLSYSAFAAYGRMASTPDP